MARKDTTIWPILKPEGGAWLKANKPDQELGLPPADGVEESKSRGWRTA